MSDKTCPRCGLNNIFIEEDEESTIEKVCLSCGARIEVSRKTMKPVEITPKDLPIKPTRRIHGISAKESRRYYHNSPAGKAAWERYRRSELFYEAHARHRQTETYKQTQERFKQKVRLFNAILYPPAKSTCPLNLFFEGPNQEVYHNRSKCDFDPVQKDCTMTCININGSN